MMTNPDAGIAEPAPANPAMNSALADMHAVMNAHPQLTDHGFGIFDGYRRKPIEERKAIFARDRACLTEERALGQFDAARAWLRQWSKLKRINPRVGSSYHLKHVAQDAIGYSTNGVFIAAAIAEGFMVKRCDWSSPNAWLNIPSKVGELGWKKIRRP